MPKVETLPFSNTGPASGSAPPTVARKRKNRGRSNQSTRKPVHVQPHLFGSPTALVADFHKAFGLVQNTQPTLDIPIGLKHLRQALMEEETQELRLAVDAGDLVGIADALADIVYIAYGTAITYGLTLDAIIAEVHRSNMTKLGSNGKPILRDDGKVIKGPSYSPPQLMPLLKMKSSGSSE